MQLRERLRSTVARLSEAGVDNPRLDAELLIAEACGISRAQLLTADHELPSAADERAEQMIARRIRREPIAYILGRKEFYAIDLRVTPDVLIPRPETETLVNAALDWLRDRPSARVLDMGAGSGAIALALALNAEHVELVACDCDHAALAVAKANATRLGLGGRIDFRLTDAFQPLDSAESLGQFGLIVSNPPYVASAEIDSLQPEIRDWEPRIALDGGADGLGFYRRIAGPIDDHLRIDGALMLEIGTNQPGPLSSLLANAGFSEIEVRPDLSGRPRLLCAKRA